jgi:predicted DNA-binding transcriptional regulator YafY
MNINYKDVEDFLLFSSIFSNGVKKKDIMNSFGIKRIETENIINEIKSNYIVNKVGQSYILDLERNNLDEVINSVVKSKSFSKCSFAHVEKYNTTNLSINLLLTIIKAIKEKKVLDIEYLDYELNSTPIRIRIDALYLLYIDEKWHLKSHSHISKSLFLTPLSRITTCSLVNKSRVYKLNPRPTYTKIMCSIHKDIIGIHKSLMLKEFESPDNEHVYFDLMKDEYFHYQKKYILKDSDSYSTEFPYKCFVFVKEINIL